MCVITSWIYIYTSLICKPKVLSILNAFSNLENMIDYLRYRWLGLIVNFDSSYPVFGDLSFDGGVVVTDGRVGIQQSLSLLHPFHHVFPHYKELYQRATQNITMCQH